MRIYQLPIEMVNALRSWFHPKDRLLYLGDSQYIISKRVSWETTYSRYSLLPGTVGFWTMNNISRGTGDVYDSSPQNRTLTLNGNPVFGLWDSLVPYVDFDGSGDFLSRADETDLDIRGTEVIFPAGSRGLTLGGWFRLDTLSGGTARGFINKYTTAGSQRAYTLILNASSAVLGAISVDGVVDTTVTGPGLAVNLWYFLVLRFVPLTSLDVFVGNPIAEAPNDWVKTSNTTSIPASIFASTANLEIGRFNQGAANVMDGRAALCFLCQNALPDDLLEMLFRQSSVLFK